MPIASRRIGAPWGSGLGGRGPPGLALRTRARAAPWVPGAEISGDPVMLTLRALAWCAISLSILQWTFRRTELGT